MQFFLPALSGILAVFAVVGAYSVGRRLTASLAMQAGAARMPQGAAHDIA
jgi:hypothetical protein